MSLSCRCVRVVSPRGLPKRVLVALVRDTIASCIGLCIMGFQNQASLSQTTFLTAISSNAMRAEPPTQQSLQAHDDSSLTSSLTARSARAREGSLSMKAWYVCTGSGQKSSPTSMWRKNSAGAKGLAASVAGGACHESVQWLARSRHELPKAGVQ